MRQLQARHAREGTSCFINEVFTSFQTYSTELFVLTLVLILVQDKGKEHIHKTIHETRQGLGFRVSGLGSSLNYSRDKTEINQRKGRGERTHRLSLQMKASQTGEKAV